MTRVNVPGQVHVPDERPTGETLRFTRRVGFTSGYGLGAARLYPHASGPILIPSLFYVPGWVPHNRVDPLSVAWRNGWDDGLAAGLIVPV